MNFRNFDEYINALQSSKSCVGGGSANAVLCKVAVALVLKSLNVSSNRKSFQKLSKEEQKEHLNNIKTLEKSLKVYDSLIQKDIKAFENYMKVYKLGNEKKTFKATENCFNVPYQLYLQINNDLKIILKEKNFIVKSIISDYEMALSLCKTILESSLYNLKINADLLDSNYQDKYNVAKKNITKAIKEIEAALN